MKVCYILSFTKFIFLLPDNQKNIRCLRLISLLNAMRCITKSLFLRLCNWLICP